MRHAMTTTTTPALAAMAAMTPPDRPPESDAAESGADGGMGGSPSLKTDADGVSGGAGGETDGEQTAARLLSVSCGRRRSYDSGSWAHRCNTHQTSQDWCTSCRVCRSLCLGLRAAAVGAAGVLMVVRKAALMVRWGRKC